MTGAGLYTYTPITDYDLRNKQNVLLLGGFLHQQQFGCGKRV